MPDLSDRLAALGFNLFFPNDGADAKKRWLGHAVREFQIYASMPRVAQQKAGPATSRWLDRLRPVPNAHVYAGPKDGDANAAEFQASLAAWEADSYRCPVVADVFCLNDKGVLTPLTAGGDGVQGNYWRYDDPRIVAFQDGKNAQLGRLLVRVCDLTGHFRPAHDTAPENMEAAGGIASFGKDWRGGFVTRGGDDDEILPETLIGSSWDQITSEATKSTFRILRAVSEVEAAGRFDGINGYDDACMSLGPFNWALAPARGASPQAPDAKAGAGELAPYLAYWSGREPGDASAKLFDPFGISVRPAWPAGQAGPRKPSWPSTRNYVGRMDWAPLDSEAEPGKKRLSDLEWLHTTHWFWRFLALSRHVSTFRRRQWDLGRTRLRDVLAYEIDPKDRPDKPAGANKVRLDRMFTSEVAVALLLRCHVRWSGFLSQGKFRGPSLRLALALADLPPDVDKWTDPEQAQLIEGIIAACAFNGLTKVEKQTLKGKIGRLHESRTELANRPPTSDPLYANCRALAVWPDPADYRWSYPKKPPARKYALAKTVCVPALSHAHGSFKLDATALPPMP